jgi:serine/threonine-protein kinase
VRVRREFSEDVERGRVIETSPPARTLYERGRTVDLFVSRGPEQVDVPDVVGLDQDEAERRLQERELRVRVVEEETADQDPRTVLRQDPAPETKVDRDSEVTITVAKEPSRVAVPDVVGLEADDAIDELQTAGFRVRQEQTDVETPDEDGVVVAQSPPPGEERPKDSRVVITIGRFTPPNLDPDPTETPTPSPEAP